MKIKRLRGQSGLAWFLEILVAVQFALIIYVNFVQTYYLFDYDSSLAFRHGMEIWKHGLFLKDFSYYSTMEIDTVAFFGSLLYLVTGNLRLALAVPHIAGYLVLAFAIWDICGHIHVTWEQSLTALVMVFTPYTAGMLGWGDMIFVCGGQYGFRLAVLLFLLDLLLMCKEKWDGKKKFVVLLSFYLLLVFWTSLSAGNFVLCMIIFPFACWVVLEIYLCRDPKLFAGSAIVILLSILSSLAGWLLRSQNIGATHRENLSLVPADRWFENLQSVISGVFLLFGGGARNEDISVFSVEGVVILLHFALPCCLFLVLWYEWKVRKSRSFFFKAILVYSFIYISVLLLVDTGYGNPYFEYRYHLPWCLLLAISGGISIMGLWKPSGGLRNGVVYGFLLLMAGLNLWQGYQYTQLSTREYEYISRIIGMAENLGVKNIYAYNERYIVPQIRVFVPELYCVNIMSDENGMQAETGDFYIYYGDRTAAGDANMLVCNSEQFETLPNYVKSCYRQVDSGTYWSETNPWDGVSGLPGEGVDVSVDFPYSAGYFGGGEFADNGVLVGNQTENDDYLLRGPNTEPVPGTYDITLSYGIFQEGSQPSRFEVIVDDHEPLAEADLLFGEETVTLKGVEVSEGDAIEFRVWKPKDAIITVRQFTFERVR